MEAQSKHVYVLRTTRFRTFWAPTRMPGSVHASEKCCIGAQEEVCQECVVGWVFFFFLMQQKLVSWVLKQQQQQKGPFQKRSTPSSCIHPSNLLFLRDFSFPSLIAAKTIHFASSSSYFSPPPPLFLPRTDDQRGRNQKVKPITADANSSSSSSYTRVKKNNNSSSLYRVFPSLCFFLFFVFYLV